MTDLRTLHPSPAVFALTALLALSTSACVAEVDGADERELGSSELTSAQKLPRYVRIRDAARAHGIQNTAYLLGGIANTETGLAMCWSEATWACQGPNSPDCGGGPVISGAADGPCSIRQGGLGMFQFDAGTHWDTLNRYGERVLTIEGQIEHAIAYVTRMVKNSVYTTNAETDAKARAWLANFDIHNATLRDQWIKTVLRYYNGCQPGWSCWAPRYQTYSDGMWLAVNEPGGLEFWRAGGDVRCGDSPAVIGAIAAKYRSLGGCGSALGAPLTEERTTPDGVGRYTHFENGSIYWTPATGAHEVHGAILDRWAALGWETGPLGYPVTDERPSADGVGRYSEFEHGAIYWHPDTGAYEVHGAILAEWAELEWENGELGYPISGESAARDGVGRYGEFENGVIYWHPDTGAHAVWGLIGQRWSELDREAGVLGYPLTREQTTPDGSGRYNHFEHGSIYWTPWTGAHEVRGAIRDRWEALGWERSELGYPVSGHYEVAGGERCDFERGSITWNATTGETTVHLTP